MSTLLLSMLIASVLFSGGFLFGAWWAGGRGERDP